MLFDWNAYQAELTKSIPDFAKLSPDSLKGYQTLSAANSFHSPWRSPRVAMVASLSTPTPPSKPVPLSRKLPRPSVSPWP